VQSKPLGVGMGSYSGVLLIVISRECRSGRPVLGIARKAGACNRNNLLDLRRPQKIEDVVANVGVLVLSSWPWFSALKQVQQVNMIGRSQEA
jgi:hypothetical protein